MLRNVSEDFGLENFGMLRETGWEVVDWIHLAQDRDQWRTLANTVMNFWVP
jgi:hypothetical protein